MRHIYITVTCVIKKNGNTWGTLGNFGIYSLKHIMDVLDTFPISNCFSTLSKLEPDQGNGNSTHHSQPLGNHYHDISCSNDIKCSFLHGNLQSCNYNNNNNLTTKKQKTTAEGGQVFFFPCVFLQRNHKPRADSTISRVQWLQSSQAS